MYGNLKVRTRTALVPVVAIAAMVVMVVNQHVENRGIVGQLVQIRNTITASQDLSRFERVMTDAQLQLHRINTAVLLGQSDTSELRRRVEDSLDLAPRLAETALKGPPDVIARVRVLLPRFLEQAREALELSEIDPFRAGEVLQDADVTFDELDRALEKLNRRQNGKLIGDAEAFVADTRTRTIIAWVVFAGASLLAGVLSFAVARSISAPVTALTQRMQALAASADVRGETAGAANPTPDDGGGNEIARLEQTFNAMVDARTRAEERMHQAKDEAELANRAKSEFLANMSHELRTPLNAIIGFAELIRAERFGTIGPQNQAYAKDIHEAGQHLLALINDILDISKIEAGSMQLNEEPIELPVLCRTCTEMLSEKARAKQLDMHIDLAGDLPLLCADHLRVKQMLINLLSNAVKFTERGGQVVLSANRDEAGAIVLEVRDTGIGMNAKDVEQALRPFGQITDSSYARQQEGTGLGLSLVKSLAKLHDASLDILSERNQGTRIRMVFPNWRSEDASIARLS